MFNAVREPFVFLRHRTDIGLAYDIMADVGKYIELNENQQQALLDSFLMPGVLIKARKEATNKVSNIFAIVSKNLTIRKDQIDILLASEKLLDFILSVWGPPGSRKTFTIAAMTVLYAFLGYKVVSPLLEMEASCIRSLEMWMASRRTLYSSGRMGFQTIKQAPCKEFNTKKMSDDIKIDR